MLNLPENNIKGEHVCGVLSYMYKQTGATGTLIAVTDGLSVIFIAGTAQSIYFDHHVDLVEASLSLLVIKHLAVFSNSWKINA